MKINDIKAVMAIRHNPKEDVGTMRITDTFLEAVPEVDIEFISKYDMEDPKQENFNDYVKKIVNGVYPPKNSDIELLCLTEVPFNDIEVGNADE